MEHGETILLSVPVERTWSLVDDLEKYPQWMSLVHSVVREINPKGSDSSEPDASNPAWAVDLRARLGPFARSKKLRMQRIVHDVDASGVRVAIFDRCELDGRTHSQWRLEVRVSPDGSGSRVDVTLQYSGALFGPVVEAALRHYVAEGRERLATIATSTG